MFHGGWSIVRIDNTRRFFAVTRGQIFLFPVYKQGLLYRRFRRDIQRGLEFSVARLGNVAAYNVTHATEL